MHFYFFYFNPNIFTPLVMKYMADGKDSYPTL